MLKQILNLKGAQQLSKKEQNSINGGAGEWCVDHCQTSGCPSNEQCIKFACTEENGTETFEWVCMPDNQQ